MVIGGTHDIGLEIAEEPVSSDVTDREHLASLAGRTGNVDALFSVTGCVLLRTVTRDDVGHPRTVTRRTTGRFDDPRR